MVKHLKIFFSSFEAESWCVALGTQGLEKFIQMMIVGWLLPFYCKVKFDPPYICMGKMLKNHFLNKY